MRESTKRFALDGSHHRCSPLWAKNSPLDCFLNAQTLSGSIPKAESVSKRHQLTTCIKHFGDSCGNRTRVAGVRGRSLNRLTNEPFFKGLIVVSPLPLVHHQGLEPGTPWLRVRCSTNWANGAYFFYETDKSEIRLLSVSRLKSSSFLTFRSRALRYLDVPFVVRLKRSLLPHPFGQVPWKLNKVEINQRSKYWLTKVHLFVWSSPRPISTAKLNASRHWHTQPINLVVIKGSYSFTRWDI